MQHQTRFRNYFGVTEVRHQTGKFVSRIRNRSDDINIMETGGGGAKSCSSTKGLSRNLLLFEARNAFFADYELRTP